MRVPLYVCVVVLLAASCASPAPHPAPPPATDPADRVVPYSYALEKTGPAEPPFLARFERGDQHLAYVAVEHGCDPATFRLIDRALSGGPVARVVIEGYPNDKGLDPAGYRRHLAEWAGAGFCRGGGEGAYAVTHATEHGASFVGAEPDEHAVAGAVLRHGYSAEDLLGFYFVRQVPQLRREGALASEGVDVSFAKLVSGMGKRAGLEDAAARFTLGRFRAWYASERGHAFDAATLDGEEPAPLADGTLLTQQVSAVVGRVRDRFIVGVIARALAEVRNVLVVYGGSHFLTQAPALEALMGKPIAVERAPLEDAGSR